MFKFIEYRKSDFEDYQYFRFSVIDYVIFFLMIILSTGTGIYFGYYKRKPIPSRSEDEHRSKFFLATTTMSEYLLGSRALKTFPVAMSLVGSYVSGVTILGTAAEIYNYGTQYWIIVVAIIFMGFVVSFVYLPVFAKLKVGSSYQYLEMRFNTTVRSIASIMFVMDELFFLPMVLYVPSIALSQVTGIDLHIISAIECIGCVIYTILGGIKAVVHTDAWQILVMFISVVVVVVLGSVFVGSPSDVFKEADKGGRLIFFNTSPSLYERNTMMSVIFGGFMYWTSFNSVNQTMVQRYMSLPTLRNGQKSIAIFTVGILLFVSFCCYSGLLIYYFYRNCDPYSSGLVDKDDQLFPVFVMQTTGHLHGIAGLFIAGIFGAALSSLSVVLNATSLVILEDIVKGVFKVEPSTKLSHIIVKGSIVVLGCIAFALVFVVERMGGILSVATSLTAIAASVSFGLFTLGMLIPWSNSAGATIGAVAGVIMASWVSFGINGALATGLVSPSKLEVSVSGCEANITLPEEPHRDESDVFPLYRLSYHWVNPIGVFSTILVGVIASFLTGPTKTRDLDFDLMSPVIYRFLPKERNAETEMISNTARK